MTTHTDPTSQSPAEIDTVLATNWAEQAKATQYRASYAEALQRLGTGIRAERAAAQVAEYDAQIAALRADAKPYEAEYVRRGRWNRYFIVRNTGGHVHREMSCSTCYPTTVFGWLPELSDCDEQAMVAEYGEMACTVCFPEAPVMRGFNDGTSALAQFGAAERAERTDAKAQRDAAKAAKTLDTPVRVAHYADDSRGGDTIRTVAAAKSWIKDSIDSVVVYEYNWDTATLADGVARLTEALAAKGVDVAPMIVKWTAAAHKAAGK
jgi:hypothetical protein